MSEVSLICRAGLIQVTVVAIKITDLIVDKLISLPEVAKSLMSLDSDTLTSKYDKIFLQVYYSLRNSHACM